MTKAKLALRLPQNQLTVHSLCVFLIATYMLLLPFEYVLTSEFGSINRYIGILIIGTCVISGKFRLSIGESTLLLLCFLLYGVISGFWAISLGYWSDVFFIYLKNAALFLAVTQCRFTRDQNNFIMRCYILGSILLVFYLITSSNVYVDALSGRTVISVAGGFFDPNYMAADIIMPMGYAYGLFYKNLAKNQYKQMIGPIAVIVLLFYIIIVSGSRGALLATFAMFFFITVFNLRNKAIRRRVLMIALVLFLLFLIVLQMLPEQIAERFSLDSLLGKTDSGGGRIELWVAALQGIRDNFFFGYGAGCAIPAVGMYHGTDRAAHSLYFSSVLEFGVFALLLYAAIGMEIRRAYHRRQYEEVGMAIGILIACAFLDSLTTKFFWSFLMILFMRNRMQLEEDEPMVLRLHAE